MTLKSVPTSSSASSASSANSAPKKPKPRIAKTSAKAAAPAASEIEGGIRLNVYLQEQGIASRRKADTMIEQGRVQVDGVVCKKLGSKVLPSAEIRVDGKPVRSVGSKKVVLMFNKPDLTLTSRSDTQGRQTVFDLPALKKLPPGCQAVGRLDYRSEGLLLLTNDGDLAYALTHPRYAVEKTYAVLVADSVNAEDVDRLRKGVKLDDGFAKPVGVRLGSKEKLGASRGQWIEIVVAEGRNRLIRRMMDVVGLNVLRLVRLAIGDVQLPEKLGAGHVVTLVGAELAYLNRIKLDMLQERDEPAKPAAIPVLTEAEKLKRRLKRKLSLNDAEYAEERERRSAEAGSHRRTRKEAIEAAEDAKPRPNPMPAPLPAPTPRAPAPRAAAASKGSAPVRRSEPLSDVPTYQTTKRPTKPETKKAAKPLGARRKPKGR